VRKPVLLSLLVWLFTGVASAQATEPNDSFAARTLLSPGVLTVSDVLTPGVLGSPDTLLGVRDHFGNIYDVNDDDSPLGNGTASGLAGVPTNSGDIDFSITGFGDESFTGSHGEVGDYKVFVDVYDFFGDPVDHLSETHTLQPGQVDNFMYSDFNWNGGSYDVYIDNTVGGVVGGDIDFFTFQGLTAGAAFTAQTFDPTSSGIDTIVGWFNSSGVLVSSDDDGAGGLLSKLEGVVPAGGKLTFAVTGAGDPDFTGKHTEDDPYELRLSLAGAYAADFTHDGRVNSADLTAWRNAFKLTAAGDADNDGDSDGADFLIWQRQLGSGASAASVATGVPEPGALEFTLAVLALSSIGQFRSFRSQQLYRTVSIPSGALA
jgi:hypothetical protein